jgi:hypothetical protein
MLMVKADWPAAVVDCSSALPRRHRSVLKLRRGVGLVFRLQVMGVPAGGEAGYTIVAGSKDGCFFPGRAATVMWKGRVVGSFGVVHPEVLDRIGLSNPASVMEVDLHPFVNL